MPSQLSRFVLIATAMLFYAGIAQAGPTHDPYPNPVPAPTYTHEDVFPTSHDAMCGAERCGIMTIDSYAAGFFGDPSTTVGAQISGSYTNLTGKETHYIQAIIEVKRGGVNPDEMYLKSPDGSSIAPPLVDTPPGGYAGQPFDFKPYYDEGDFPDFFDAPKVSLTRVATESPVTVKFETWIVCVIEEDLDFDPTSAKGDFYDVATLLGFEWGFTASFDGTDYDVEKLPFNWITGNPSARWFQALDNTYNLGEDLDWFNVSVNDCADCRIPEPTSFALWIVPLGLIIIPVMVGRRRRVAKIAA